LRPFFNPKSLGLKPSLWWLGLWWLGDSVGRINRGSWAPVAASPIQFLAFSFCFQSFFHWDTPRNLKWIFFTLHCLKKKSYRNPWSSISYQWSFTRCLDLSIYIVSHYKTLNTYGVAWFKVKVNYNSSSKNSTMCSSNHWQLI